MRPRRYWLEPVLGIVVLLAAWEGACRLLHLPPYLLPPPSAIGHEIVAGFPVLMGSAGVTLARALVALILSGLISTALALAVAASPRLEAMVRPLATTVQVTPIVAIAPLIVIWERRHVARLSPFIERLLMLIFTLLWASSNST